jgi:ADP-ribose pyrophosphatase YjhB (NUDIX family)
MDVKRPRVGLGVVVVNDEGKILMLHRTSAHAPYWSIPGGSLELGETFEAGATRELQEECNITLVKPKVVAITNNLETYAEEGVHFISVILLAERFKGEVNLLEPDKHSEFRWVDPRELPQPHFEASRLGVQCYLDSKIYVQ